MQFKKQRLSEATQGYCITSLPILGQDRIIGPSHRKVDQLYANSIENGPHVTLR
jgi:hypothetical protein